MASQYKKFLNVIKSWPVDKSKGPKRDIAVLIQEEVKKAFGHGPLSVADEQKCSEVLASLTRLNENYYGQKYRRTVSSSATGLSRQECNDILSADFLAEVNKPKRNLFSFLFNKKSYSKKLHLIKNAVNYLHTPVMTEAVLEMFEPCRGQVFIDMTFGAGGHTQQILDSAPDTKVYALDRDPVAHEIAQQFSASYPGRVIPLLGKFSDLPHLLRSHRVRPNSVDGILFDLGCSSMQFDEGYRGFSVNHDGPLDMRMDGNRIPDSITAADVLAKVEEHELAKILSVYGEEKKAKIIARSVVEARYMLKPLRTTKQLAETVAAIVDSDIRLDKLKRPAHVATKTFQALRIFVNNELNELNYGLMLAHAYMKIGGTVVALSFHSLEDRIIKCHLNENMSLNVQKGVLGMKASDYSHYSSEKELESLKSDLWKPLLKHVLVASAKEVEDNPRSRSVKLRAAKKIK